MKFRSMNSNFLTVSSWTLASRVLGFVRDITMAALLGTGPMAEFLQWLVDFGGMSVLTKQLT